MKLQITPWCDCSWITNYYCNL